MQKCLYTIAYLLCPPQAMNLLRAAFARLCCCIDVSHTTRCYATTFCRGHTLTNNPISLLGANSSNHYLMGSSLYHEHACTASGPASLV